MDDVVVGAPVAGGGGCAAEGWTLSAVGAVEAFCCEAEVVAAVVVGVAGWDNGPSCCNAHAIVAS